MPETRKAWLLLIPVLLVVTWIGAHGLNADAFWFDEYWSVYNAGGAHYGPLSPAGIWERVAAQDPWQSPGYFLLLGGWGGLVGWTEYATRPLSLLLGVLSVAWAYRLGRDLVSPLGGLGAALTLGASAYYLYYFHELRTYTLLTLLILVTVWAYWQVISHRKAERGYQLFLFLGSLGLLYTHYLAALTLGILGLYHLLFAPKDGRWRRAALPFLAAGLLFLPWLGVVVSGLNAATQDLARQAEAWTPRQAIGGLLFMFSNGNAALALALGIYSLQRRRTAIFAWFWLLILLGLLLLINARFGVILEARYLMPLWPALALVAAIAVDRLARNGAGGFAYAALAVWLAAGVWNSVDSASAYTLSNPHWHQPWHLLAEELRPRAQAGDTLIYLLPDWTWKTYHQKPFDHYLYGLPVKGALLERPENLGEEAYGRQLKAAADWEGEWANRVWLAWTPEQPTAHLEAARQQLDFDYIACGTYSVSDKLQLELYKSKLDRSFDPIEYDKFALVSLDMRRMDTNNLLKVVALWSNRLHDEAAAPHTYSAALHVDNAFGQLVAQADYGLPNVGYSCKSVDIPLDKLPAGEYILYALVYAWQTGERLMATTPDGDSAERVEVGRFMIAQASG